MQSHNEEIINTIHDNHNANENNNNNNDEGAVVTVFYHGTCSNSDDDKNPQYHENGKIVGETISVLRRNCEGREVLNFLKSGDEAKNIKNFYTGVDGPGSGNKDHADRLVPPTKYSQQMQIAFGFGVDENIQHVLEALRQLKKRGVKLKKVILNGWSRGAVECIETAFLMSHDPDLCDIDVYMFCFDPVPGIGNVRERNLYLNTNVKHAVFIYPGHEFSLAFGAVVPKALSYTTYVQYIVEPGQHATVTGNPGFRHQETAAKYPGINIFLPQTGKTARWMAYQFNKQYGTQFKETFKESIELTRDDLIKLYDDKASDMEKGVYKILEKEAYIIPQLQGTSRKVSYADERYQNLTYSELGEKYVPTFKVQRKIKNKKGQVNDFHTFLIEYPELEPAAYFDPNRDPNRKEILPFEFEDFDNNSTVAANVNNNNNNVAEEANKTNSSSLLPFEFEDFAENSIKENNSLNNEKEQIDNLSAIEAENPLMHTEEVLNYIGNEQLQLSQFRQDNLNASGLNDNREAKIIKKFLGQEMYEQISTYVANSSTIENIDHDQSNVSTNSNNDVSVNNNDNINTNMNVNVAEEIKQDDSTSKNTFDNLASSTKVLEESTANTTDTSASSSVDISTKTIKSTEEPSISSSSDDSITAETDNSISLSATDISNILPTPSASIESAQSQTVINSAQPSMNSASSQSSVSETNSEKSTSSITTISSGVATADLSAAPIARASSLNNNAQQPANMHIHIRLKFNLTLPRGTNLLLAGMPAEVIGNNNSLNAGRNITVGRLPHNDANNQFIDLLRSESTNNNRPLDTSVNEPRIEEMSDIDTTTHPHQTHKELIESLIDYIFKRFKKANIRIGSNEIKNLDLERFKQYRSQLSKSYYHCFSRFFGGHSGEDKISAALKVIALIKETDPSQRKNIMKSISKVELESLRESELGAIMKAKRSDWPEEIKKLTKQLDDSETNTWLALKASR